MACRLQWAFRGEMQASGGTLSAKPFDAARRLSLIHIYFMQEDTQAGMIYAYLEDYTGDRVCSKQLYDCLLYTSIKRD